MRVDAHVFYACSAETIDASVDFVLTISDAFSYIERSKYFPVKPTKSKYENSKNTLSHSLSNMMTKRAGK